MTSGVRERNESAWLIPNDGTRTNHRLRRDMRRFDDTVAVRPVGAEGAVATGLASGVAVASSDQAPCPAELTAATRNRTGVPAVRPVTSRLVAVGVPTSVQTCPSVDFSTT